MICKNFKGESISALGFGTMRLPTISGDEIDEVKVREMTAYAISHGVNYFDTAYPYHGGNSERVMGRVLSDYPRESFKLASKFPGHMLLGEINAKAIFEEQLQKCRVDYFDFYLLHNVCEKSLSTFTDTRWGIIPYLIEEKKAGRIRHLGFSSHGGEENLREFLDKYGDEMEFCQIQLNYLDWTLQDAKTRYEMLTERGIPVWVMEPLRGGKLAQLSDEAENTLHALRPQENTPAWAFRFLQGLDNVQVVLSGMSTLEQMQDNIATFETNAPLNDEEKKTIFAIAEQLKKSVPCTACRYCCDGCPKGLDIPLLISLYNQYCYQQNVMIGMRIESMPEGKRPSACISCGKCARVCPQQIAIPDIMHDFAERLAKNPTWDEICVARAEAQARNRK